MTFDDFRRWALDQTRSSARRWEDPTDDEVKVLLGVDDYDAMHVVPLPPLYLERDRGYLYWLAGVLPAVVRNRSLKHIAFRASGWMAADPEHSDRPVDDPNRRELLILDLASKGRYEAWHAQIRRSTGGLPSVGAWELCGTQDDDPAGNLPHYINAALEQRGPSLGPTMPAAEMVLGPWDVPRNFVPPPGQSGPLDVARDNTQSSYLVIYRPEAPGPVIASQVLVYKRPDAPRGHIQGAVESLRRAENYEFDGKPWGDEVRYFEGELGNLRRLTALWRYPSVFCEVALCGPPGRYSRKDLFDYVDLQDHRARTQIGKQRIA